MSHTAFLIQNNILFQGRITMKQCFFFFSIFFIMLLACPITSLYAAACDPHDPSDGSFCVSDGGFSIVGGGTQSTDFKVIESNMYPYEQWQSQNDFDYWHKQAVIYLDNGTSFRDNNLLLMGAVADNSARGKMLQDLKLNYETAGLLTGFDLIEENLIIARDTFAYEFYIGYTPSDASDPKKELLDTIKLLANMYIMIGDQLLINAVEYRFSSATLGIDAKLDEQICLLGAGKENPAECMANTPKPYSTPQHGAQYYYEKAVNSFIYGFSPVVGTNLYVSDYFNDAVFSLFNLSTERLSMALREKSSKQLARQMSPDSTQEWNTARQAGLSTVRDISTTAYLAAAAAADKANTSGGASFDENGGDSLTNALSALRKQGDIYNSNLNPLGYDNRYVPMYDYSTLIVQAKSYLASINSIYQPAFDAEKRDFDSNYVALQSQINSLQGSYGSTLVSLTGCTLPDVNNQTELSAFIDCTGLAGWDLLDCQIDNATSDTDFETCLAAQATTGVLASKYRNIMEAQIKLNAARKNRDDILEKINYQNEFHSGQVAIKRSQQNAQTVMIDKYYALLKKARTETDTVEHVSGRTKTNGKWVKNDKTKTHSTTETFYIRNDQLMLDTDKEKDLLDITTDYEILQVDLDNALAIKNLFLSEAEAEIEVELTAFQKNSAVADFDNTFKEKETQWFLYQNSLNQLNYNTQTPTLRVLQSQAAIQLSEALNYTAHYAYLAAKALEYQYLTPLTNVIVPGGNLRITDLFKAQTLGDMQNFINKLDSFNTLSCPWGYLDPYYQTVSLANDILGLYGLSASAKNQKLQAFINEHINSQGKLEFSFTISEANSFLASSGAYNLKIWNGAIPSNCGSLTTGVKGVSVGISTSQTSQIRSRIQLTQTGHSSFRNSTGDILEYIPVYDYQFLLEGSGDYAPYKQVQMLPFINVDPRQQTGTGEWKGAFQGRGVSSSQWSMLLLNSYGDINLGKIQDIILYIDTIGACCYQ